MKKTTVRLLLLAILASTFTSFGCGNFDSQTISDYYRPTATSSTTAYYILYSATTVNNASATGYSVKQTLPTITYTIATTPKENYSSYTLPQIAYNRIKIVYTIAQDTQGNLGTWTPTTIDTGLSVIVPTYTASQGATSTANVTVTLPQIASSALATEVFTRIGSVTASATGSGTYAFLIGLSTSLAVKATVTLYGTDDFGKDVILTFPTTLYFSTTTS